MPLRLLLAALVLLLVGCGRSSLPITKTNSPKFATLAERAEFLHKYVSFRRTYETLDFDIVFLNNSGGMVPGPSDWDLRFVATVPEAELHNWIPTNGNSFAPANTNWLSSVPTNIDLSGITEWYRDGGREVGIDRNRRIVAYRNYTR